MKKLIFGTVIAALTAGLSVTGLSAAPYGMAGCGLGSIVIGPGGGIMQIFAATTNGTFYSQFFGITSGTSNCVESSDAAAYQEYQQELFVHVNYSGLEQEMAAGQGEKLNAFADLLGCSADELGAFSQENYDSIFSATSAENPSHMLTAVKTGLKSSEMSCSRI